MDDPNDEDAAMLLGQSWQKAAKEHICTGCRKKIPVGQRYRRRFGILFGDPIWDKTCADCEAEEKGWATSA